MVDAAFISVHLPHQFLELHSTFDEVAYRFRPSPIDRRFHQRCNGRLDTRVKSQER